ncbi:MAG: ribosome biogenesis GTP-binding protein YihA/YsxC [Candidatus Paceibacterota bacterium]
MEIKLAKFIKGVIGTDEIFKDNVPQIAFIGRSNSGKSSVINALTNRKDLARTSAVPGFTQQINLFLINNCFYLVDLPGYGYAKVPLKKKEKIQSLINWYFFNSDCVQEKIFLIIDAEVGLTRSDLEMIFSLEDYGKNLIIIANKIDKIKKSKHEEQFEKIEELAGGHKIIPFSAKNKIGIEEVLNEIEEALSI